MVVIHTRDTSWGVPTYLHFIPLFPLVVHGSKKIGILVLKTTINSSTIRSVP
jgi:hypothetical protein